MRPALSAALLLCLLAAASRPAKSQAIPLRPTRLNTQLNLNTFTVEATPSLVTFDLTPRGSAIGSQPITISTSWLFGIAVTVRLYAFFSGSSALSDGAAPANIIPSANILGQCDTGRPTTFTPFTQTGPYAAGSSLLVFQHSSLLSIGVTRSDQLKLKIDLSNLPQLPAGTFTGTLTLQAQAF